MAALGEVGGDDAGGPQWITDRLAVGAIEDAMRPQRLLRAGIGGVLALNRFPSLTHVPALEWVRVTLIDGAGNQPDVILGAIEALEALLRRHRVLVHCDEGLSRAPFVAACSLARQDGLSFDEALALVTRRHPAARIDPALLALPRTAALQRPLNGPLPGAHPSHPQPSGDSR